jgi:transcriptional regulator with XRE-family HTH domain
MHEFKTANEDELLKHIGASIRGSRIAGNFTLEELASKSDINITTLSKIENGLINTTILVLIRIFSSLGREKEIQNLFPAPTTSPILLSKIKNKANKLPQRVRKQKKIKSDWKWKD